jgi:hypothetical protein
MKRAHKRALFALLLIGSWLPVTLTCDPGSWGYGGDYYGDTIVVEHDCGWCWWGDCCY